jgi:hypothetical protein
MQIFYGKGAYTRSNIPRLRLVNMYVEASPASDDGVILMSRKGLKEHTDIGSVRGVYREDGVFGNDLFYVAGSTLYREGVALGTITGSGPVSFAGTALQLAVNAGQDIHVYDGTALTTAAFPDGAAVRKIIFHDGLFIAARADGHKWYWSAVLNALSWDALDFASGESRPDALLDMHVIHDMLYLFGSETLEPWANTGNPDIPYQRQELAILSKGIRGTGCLVEIDGAISFVGSDNMAYVLREGTERVSDHGIEEQIAASTEVSCFGYIMDGHSFFVIRLDSQTFAFDVATRQWSELASVGFDNFRATCATHPGTVPVFGGDKLFTMDGWADDGDEIEKLFTAAIPLDGGTAEIDNLQIDCNVGWTELLAGQGSDPMAELRTSRDAGATFGNWRQAPLGKQGEYLTRTVWRRCGMYARPGFYGEVRITDPVAVRVSSVSVNVPGGGRGR